MLVEGIDGDGKPFTLRAIEIKRGVDFPYSYTVTTTDEEEVEILCSSVNKIFVA
jgi:hypothetical protein